MRRACTIAVLLWAAAIAGCGRRQPVAAVAPDRAQAAAPASGRVLRTLNEAQRSATLFRAIHDADQRCDRVDRSAFQQTFKGMNMWVAHRTASGNWAVFVNAQGYAQVSLCPATPTSGCPHVRLSRGGRSRGEHPDLS